MALKILVVDDDKNICELLRLYLEKEGHTVYFAHDGNMAVTQFEQQNPDFILLDIMLPYQNGWQVCAAIRKQSSVPIIMLTAKGETADTITGLDLGADDYITKPFDPKEVVARINAVLRRTAPASSQQEKGDVLHYHNLEVNLSAYELVVAGKPVYAPAKELELLYYLASNPNRVFTRDQLLDAVWSFDYYGDSRTVDVHIKRLREKLEGASTQWSLKTVFRVGYKFEVKQDETKSV